MQKKIFQTVKDNSSYKIASNGDFIVCVKVAGFSCAPRAGERYATSKEIAEKGSETLTSIAVSYGAGKALEPVVVYIRKSGVVSKVTNYFKRPGSQNKIGKTEILPGAIPDANELRAGEGLAKLGYDIKYLPTASSQGVQKVRTADLSVKGVGNVDVYTPVSANPNTILKGIEKKSSQADGVLVQVNLSEDEMSNIAKRMWGKQNGKNIKVIIFQNSSGNIFEFKR